jgi:hypothetical protein
VRRADAGDVQRYRAADLADENGEANGTFDVFDYITLVRDHYAKNGIGVGYIDQLMR